MFSYWLFLFLRSCAHHQLFSENVSPFLEPVPFDFARSVGETILLYQEDAWGLQAWSGIHVTLACPSLRQCSLRQFSSALLEAP